MYVSTYICPYAQMVRKQELHVHVHVLAIHRNWHVIIYAVYNRYVYVCGGGVVKGHNITKEGVSMRVEGLH